MEVIDVPRARAAAAGPGAAADACFGGLSPFEVLAGGRKVVGLSQARRRPGTLLQAGIPLTLDAARLARLMARDEEFAQGLSVHGRRREGVRTRARTRRIWWPPSTRRWSTGSACALVDDDLTDVERAAVDRAEAAAGDLPRLGSPRWTTHDATGGASSSVACTASAA